MLRVESTFDSMRVNKPFQEVTFERELEGEEDSAMQQKKGKQNKAFFFFYKGKSKEPRACGSFKNWLQILPHSSHGEVESLSPPLESEWTCDFTPNGLQ